MRSLVGEHPKQWDHALPQVEFAYIDSSSMSTCFIPFQILYGINPRGIYGVRDLGKIEMRSPNVEDFATTMQSLHHQVKKHLKDSNSKYKQSGDLRRKEVQFEVKDIVLAHLRKNIFPKGEYNKLNLKKYLTLQDLKVVSS